MRLLLLLFAPLLSTPQTIDHVPLRATPSSSEWKATIRVEMDHLAGGVTARRRN